MFSGYQARQVGEWFTSLADESPGDGRKNVMMLQWLATIATSYFSLFSGGSIHDDPLVLALVAGLMLTAFVLQKLPESIILSTHFNSLLIVGDIFFILLAISGSIASPPGICFCYFFSAFTSPESGKLFSSNIGMFAFHYRFYLHDIFVARKALARFGYAGENSIFVRCFHAVRLFGSLSEEREEESRPSRTSSNCRAPASFRSGSRYQKPAFGHKRLR